MVRIPGGTYTIGSPAQHPLADRQAMPEHKVTVKPFRQAVQKDHRRLQDERQRHRAP